jgi:hypothetical protein
LVIFLFCLELPWMILCVFFFNHTGATLVFETELVDVAGAPQAARNSAPHSAFFISSKSGASWLQLLCILATISVLFAHKWSRGGTFWLLVNVFQRPQAFRIFDLSI